MDADRTATRQSIGKVDAMMGCSRGAIHSVIFGVLIASGVSTRAQTAIPAGKGSYASSPPSNVQYSAQIQAIQNQELFLVNEKRASGGTETRTAQLPDRPIPTNKWWTQLVVSRFARSLWTYPFKIDTGNRGLDVFLPVKWQPEGNDPQCDFPLHVGGTAFNPEDARAKDWSDWSVSFRMAQSPTRYFDATLGEGMPCVWMEYHGVQPELTLPGGAEAQFFDSVGRIGGLPS
jgi:endoglucanase Acf2